MGLISSVSISQEKCKKVDWNRKSKCMKLRLGVIKNKIKFKVWCLEWR